MATNRLCLRSIKLPPDKVLIPGVVKSKSNFIEHPELIANRSATMPNWSVGKT